MSSKIFLDSSILIEYRKGSKTKLLDHLLDEPQYELFISQSVVSEYLYHILALFGGKSPLSLKTSGTIASTLSPQIPDLLIGQMNWLPDTSALFTSSVSLMVEHNLLPNDALILALCQLHQIPLIASYDPDFYSPCLRLNIRLIQSVEDLER